ncbi:hypothetical protein EVAR_9961_1 [Eumeta japonica]|uniref:Uncharacterized protein n=1 Tax=Eumeta variegata TaxID=151549 RepID=A0A4C1TQW3_EUMVA|nr:hypothetical protein EVAR_9961_1 [Eumeta japonica]
MREYLDIQTNAPRATAADRRHANSGAVDEDKIHYTNTDDVKPNKSIKIGILHRRDSGAFRVNNIYYGSAGLTGRGAARPARGGAAAGADLALRAHVSEEIIDKGCPRKSCADQIGGVLKSRNFGTGNRRASVERLMDTAEARAICVLRKRTVRAIYKRGPRHL